jgi:hypothetical protein
MAQDEARRLKKARAVAVDEVMQDLELKAADFVTARKFGEAALVYERYSGPLAAQTRARRERLAEDYRERQAQTDAIDLKEKDRAGKVMAKLRDDVVGQLLVAQTAKALELVNAASQDGSLTASTGDLSRLRKELESALALENGILKSFEADKGNEITVHLNSGALRLTVVSVANGRVDATENRNVGSAAVSAVATIHRPFTLGDLAPLEKITRIGPDTNLGAPLLKGLILLKARSYDTAKRLFASADPLIAERLVQWVDEVKSAETGTPLPANGAPAPTPDGQ